MTKSRGTVPAWLSIPLSIYSWIASAFMTMAFFLSSLVLIAPLTLIWDRRTRYMLHQVAVNWARAILLAMPLWRMRVTGKHHVKRGKRYIVVANHLSLLDILVVLAGVDTNFKFIAKQELFVIPFIGWHMALAGYIPLKRSSRESGRLAVQKARDWVQRGASLLFFPEGTRSPDGEMRDFKMGAFKIAQQEDIEILPVVVDGTHEAVPKKSWRLNRVTTLLVSIGKPVRITGKSPADAERAMRKIHREMKRRLERLRRTRRK